MTTYSWTLISPPPASGGTGGSTASGGTGTSAPHLPCPIEAYTQQDLLDLYDRLLPDHYLAPLKSPGPGYEVLQSFAAMGARLSLAVERFACAAFILSSTGGSFATGSVELYRSSPHPDGIAVTVKTGSIVKSSKGGRTFQTTADVLFGPSDLGPFVCPIQATQQGYEFNEPGIVIAADGSSLEGEIDTIEMMVQSAPSQPMPNTGTAAVTFGAPAGSIQLVSGMTGASFSPDSVGRFVTFTGATNAGNNGNRPIVEYVSPSSVRVRNAFGVAEVSTPGVAWQEYSAATDVGDLTIRVRQPSPTGGGVDASLDAHGKDRNIPRGAGEDDTSYRGRIRALPDNISPNAVDRALQQLLFPYGQSYQFLETFDVAYQTCWDAPRDAIPGSSFDPNLFVYDDPDADATPFRNRWLDLNDMRGAFVVVIPVFAPVRDTGFAFGPELPPYSLVPTGNNGIAASFVAGAPGGTGKIRVTGLAAMTALSVGRFLTVSNASSAVNNGSFLITDFVSASEVYIQHQYGVVPDANNGTLAWVESTRDADESTSVDLTNPLGVRACCAFDVPATLAFGWLQGCWDGYDQPVRTVYKNTYDTLQSIKAAGTSAAVELKGE